jgi:hypothetical protein
VSIEGSPHHSLRFETGKYSLDCVFIRADWLIIVRRVPRSKSWTLGVLVMNDILFSHTFNLDSIGLQKSCLDCHTPRQLICGLSDVLQWNYFLDYPCSLAVQSTTKLLVLLRCLGMTPFYHSNLECHLGG